MGVEPLAIKQAREWIRELNFPLWPGMTESDWATLMRDVLAEYDDRVEALRMIRSAWDAHMETCPQHAALPDLPAPSWEDLEAWRDAPSGTASAHIIPEGDEQCGYVMDACQCMKRKGHDGLHACAHGGWRDV